MTTGFGRRSPYAPFQAADPRRSGSRLFGTGTTLAAEGVVACGQQRPNLVLWLCTDMLIRALSIAYVGVALAGGARAPAAEKADWTVLAYLSGDGSLERAALGYLRKLAAVPGSDRVCLVAEVDRAPGHSSEFDDFTDARRIAFVTRGEGQRREWVRAAWQEEVNTGDPETLIGFALWGMQKFPAERYLVLLMGHGNGVRELTADPYEAPPQSGIGLDATSGGDALTVGEIGDACQRIAASGSGQISLLAVDACFSATVELASEVAPAVRCMTGSPGLIYEPGVPWDKVLSRLVGNPRMSPRELGQLAVAATQAERAAGTSPGAAYMAAELTAAPELQGALGVLTEELRSRMNELAPLVTQARACAPTSGMHWEMRELSALLGALSAAAQEQGQDALVQKVHRAREIADSMTLSAYAEDAADDQQTCRGLAVFLPPNLTIFPEDYLTSSSFAREAGWGTFVASYLKHVRDLVTRTPQDEAGPGT
jgi:hypothetical protein